MKKDTETPETKVCLLSSHAFFLSEIQKSISTSELKSQAHLLDSGSEASLSEPSNHESFTLPTAEVYVLDAEHNGQAITALVLYIRETHPECPVLVLAQEWTPESAIPLLSCGVKGLLTYSEAVHQLGRAIEAVASGGYWVPRAILSSFVSCIMDKGTGKSRTTPIRSGVSPRERQILDALLENRTNKEIANELSISERTVKFHVSNLLAKYGVRRRADLILLRFEQHTAADVPWIQ